MDTHTTIEELLKGVFSIQSNLRLHNDDQWGKTVNNMMYPQGTGLLTNDYVECQQVKL
jgi:hypothetical protein